MWYLLPIVLATLLLAAALMVVAATFEPREAEERKRLAGSVIFLVVGASFLTTALVAEMRSGVRLECAVIAMVNLAAFAYSRLRLRAGEQSESEVDWPPALRSTRRSCPAIRTATRLERAAGNCFPASNIDHRYFSPLP